jgi:methyltransferase (TIGR00027 family)
VAASAADNPVSTTAYWTLAARYEDAMRERPVANDTFAARFMDDTARTVAQRFSALKRPFASFPVRHRVIDDLLRGVLERDPTRRIVVLGCGFDTRAFRLGGGHWLEVDEPELLAIKDARLPVTEAPNDLVRIAIRFRTESLEATLIPYATTGPVAIVLEGVFGYLPDTDRRVLLTALARLFPRQVLLCDLLTRTFLARYARGLVRSLRAMDAEFAASSDHPEALLHELGYATHAKISIPAKAVDLRAPGAPPSWLLPLLPGFRDGYCVWAFSLRHTTL